MYIVDGNTYNKKKDSPSPMAYQTATGTWHKSLGGRKFTPVSENQGLEHKSATGRQFDPTSTGGDDSFLSWVGRVVERHEDDEGTAPTGSKISKEAEQDVIEKEINTLIGDLDLLPNANSFKIKTGSTIIISGIGSYLSGLYLVSNITTTINSSGYVRKYTVVKTGFGDSVKPDYVESPESNLAIKDTSVGYSVGDKVSLLSEESIYEASGLPVSVKNNQYTIQSINPSGESVKLKELNIWVSTTGITRS